MGTLLLRLRLGFGVDQRRQQDVLKPFETERIEVIVGKIEPEAAAKVPDLLLELISAQGGDGCRQLFELPM